MQHTRLLILEIDKSIVKQIDKLGHVLNGFITAEYGLPGEVQENLLLSLLEYWVCNDREGIDRIEYEIELNDDALIQHDCFQDLYALLLAGQRGYPELNNSIRTLRENDLIGAPYPFDGAELDPRGGRLLVNVYRSVERETEWA